MKSLKVLAILFGLVVARGEPAATNKANQLETKNDHQLTKPAGLETASTRTQHLQAAHYQANQLGSIHNQNIKLSHHSQIENPHFQNQDQVNQFHSQNQASQLQNQELAPQFHSQELNDQFSNQDQAQQFPTQNQAQQFHSQDLTENLSNQDQSQQILRQNQAQQYHDQTKAQQFHKQVAEMSNQQNQDVPSLQQFQQQTAPTSFSTLHSQTKQQIRDFAQQQLFSSGLHPQQVLYQSTQDQHSVAKGLVDSANQQRGLFAGFLRSTEVTKSSGLPQVYGQVSAFEKGLRPIALPGSSSVLVQGLKNLPSLPALVYSAGAVPSSQVVAYGRPWHQGGAYVSQHWQSPYARYVYSIFCEILVTDYTNVSANAKLVLCLPNYTIFPNCTVK